MSGLEMHLRSDNSDLFRSGTISAYSYARSYVRPSDMIAEGSSKASRCIFIYLSIRSAEVVIILSSFARISLILAIFETISIFSLFAKISNILSRSKTSF